MWQKYISRISEEKLEKFMVELNRIAITEGLEDVWTLPQPVYKVKQLFLNNIH